MLENLESLSFGDAIKYYRKEVREWMQFELAEKSKILVPSLSAIETGRYIPEFKKGLRLIRVLVGGKDKPEYLILVNKLKAAIDARNNQTPPYENFGLALTNALAAAGLTQGGLSERLPRGNTQLISSWCGGRQIPSAELMREVVSVLRENKVFSKEIEALRRARWVDIFMVDAQFSDMTRAERRAVADFLGDLD